MSEDRQTWDNRKRCAACKGCRYLNHAGVIYTCDYIALTGKKRPCPPGEL